MFIRGYSFLFLFGYPHVYVVELRTFHYLVDIGREGCHLLVVAIVERHAVAVYSASDGHVADVAHGHVADVSVVYALHNFYVSAVYRDALVEEQNESWGYECCDVGHLVDDVFGREAFKRE